MTLIIGGSGFIGTRLCRRLSNTNTHFSILDKRISKTFPDQSSLINICDRQKLLKFNTGTDVLVNLAAEHRDDVRPVANYYEVNVRGATHICEFADLNNITKIIFTSSVAVYGFAKRKTNEHGAINPFNDYGKSKYEAEQVYKTWQAQDPNNRSLTIIRPTVVFGEQNRGNVYNLFKQIASGRFIMVGNGSNRKSVAYVENLAAFIEYSFSAHPGVHIYNYVDKPDFDMNSLVCMVKASLGHKPNVAIRIPFTLGLFIGYCFDLISKIFGLSLQISSIRIKKFCTDSTYYSSVEKTGFIPPVNVKDAIDRTINYEFVRKIKGEEFFTE